MNVVKIITSLSLLFLCACQGEVTEQEGNINVSVDTKRAVKPVEISKDNIDLAAHRFADGLAKQFGHEALARHEIFLVSRTERYQPAQSCFDMWLNKGGVPVTDQLKADCASHLEKLEYIYSTYGYDVDRNIFKSEWFWEYASDYDYKLVKTLEGTSPLVRESCPIAKQTNYNDRRVQPLPDARPLDYCN